MNVRLFGARERISVDDRVHIKEEHRALYAGKRKVRSGDESTDFADQDLLVIGEDLSCYTLGIIYEDPKAILVGKDHVYKVSNKNSR